MIGSNLRPYSPLTPFTLVELLVVIAIISILMTLLLPSLSHARDFAKRTSCASALKQLGIAARMYADDNADQPPQGGWSYPVDTSIPGNGDIHWPYQMNAYVNKVALFACPSGASSNNPPWTTWPYITDYGYTAYANSNQFPGYFLKLSSCSRPSLTPLIIGQNGCNNFTTYCFQSGPDSIYTLAMRHSGGENILWFDGHVLWMPYQSFINLGVSIGLGKFLTSSY